MVRLFVRLSVRPSIHPSIHPCKYVVNTYVLHCRKYAFIEYETLEGLSKMIAAEIRVLVEYDIYVLKVSRTDLEELLIEHYVCPQYISDE